MRVLLAAAIALTLLPASAHGATCRVRFDHGLPGPDGGCTPGAYVRLTRGEVCTTKDRPHTPALVRRTVLGSYGVPGWTGANGEIDHRVPLFLGGLTTVGNLWPQPGPLHNTKDDLETRVYRRICFHDPYGMRVRTGRRIFLGDWRATYRSWRTQRIL